MLWDRVRRRMAAVGAREFEDYMARLSDPATGAAEWRRLEGEVTVGETYFLRYVEQFAALRGTILPEIIEIPDHPWFVGVQFHPELKSKPFDPHPLFTSFIAGAIDQSRLV